MGFFEPPPPPPEPPRRDWVGPAWLRPRGNILGRSLPLEFVVARTSKVVVAVRRLVAYPAGLEFILALRWREPQRGWHGDPLGQHIGAHERPLPDEVLRFGVQFSDGSKVTTFDMHRWGGEEEEVVGPRLSPQGGGGGDRSWDMGYWLWPLPPAGPLTFVVEWPAQGIPETRFDIDAGPIRKAAEEAEILWEDDQPSDEGSSATMFFVVVGDDDEPAGP